MRNPGRDIQDAVAITLAGITWDGEPVAIFDELAANDATFPRIILLEITGGGARDSKCGFGGDWSQLIKVSMAWPSTSRVKKNILYSITDDILQRLVPENSELNVGPDFNIWKIDGLVMSDQNYTDGAKNYIDKNIRITYSLTES